MPKTEALVQPNPFHLLEQNQALPWPGPAAGSHTRHLSAQAAAAGGITNGARPRCLDVNTQAWPALSTQTGRVTDQQEACSTDTGRGLSSA